jgi:hypothetical protein
MAVRLRRPSASIRPRVSPICPGGATLARLPGRIEVARLWARASAWSTSHSHLGSGSELDARQRLGQEWLPDRATQDE